MQKTLHHRVEYSADQIPLAEVVESLLAQQRLLEEGIAVLARAAPDSDLRLVAIHVNQIVAGSLLTDLALEIYHSYQESIDDKVIKGIEGLTGVDVPPEYESLATLAALAVTYFVARWAYEAVTQKKKKDQPALPSPPPIHIDGEYNKVVNIIANTLTISPEAIERAVSDEITPKKRRQLVGRVTDFFRPAKQNPGSSINVGGFGDLEQEAITEYPNEADLQGLEDTTILPLPNQQIEIRATDRDSLKTGWKARIIGQADIERKMPMDLYPTVDADALADHKMVVADIAVEFAREKGGSLRPKRIHLLEFKGSLDK
ncbi:hypothetical protein GRI55_09495 [Erythrobacter citreus]|uniref:Uncharacterized protein n=1 Tax=Qipengyuania citrea TaxID=225971 RepID=A0A6I4UCB2_9SPHN|nr:hypothetical protein [Qipengyuania citrea]MDQ0564979.1 hypothetical protein [Qipengyuania citrea]MXP36006.1 hypothetical protein [Qipengyuania citrea]